MKYNLFSGLFCGLTYKTQKNKIEIDDAWDWRTKLEKQWVPF